VVSGLLFEAAAAVVLRNEAMRAVNSNEEVYSLEARGLAQFLRIYRLKIANLTNAKSPIK
jgi:hypothetical protein